MHMTNKSINNPLEIKSAISTTIENEKKITKTFSVEAHLECAKERHAEDSDEIQDPLKLFEPYSVFKITLIKKFSDTNKQFVTANIPVTALSTVKNRSQIATKYIMEAEMTGLETKAVETESISPAYTVRLSVGNFKNKVPAQVLLENSNNKDALQRTADWLKDRLQLHANNEKQYEAICEAISLLETNRLKPVSANHNCKGIKIYNADLRTQKTKKREDGRSFVYSISVMCYPEKRYPYEIRITNYWAKCKGIQPIEGTIQDSVTITMNLSELDWDDAVEQMCIVKNIYVRCYGRYELERALDDFKTKQIKSKRKGA